MMILNACSPLSAHSFPAIHNRNVVGKMMIKCAHDRKRSMSTKAVVSRHLFSGLAASLIFLSPIDPVLAADIPNHLNICQIENATDNKLTLLLDESSSEPSEMLVMMEGVMDNKLTPALDESSGEESERLMTIRGRTDNKLTLPLDESSSEESQRLMTMRGMTDNKLTLIFNEGSREGGERLMMADNKLALPPDESLAEASGRLMMTGNMFALPLDESSGEGSEGLMMVGMADNKLTLPLDESSGDGNEKLMMMRGMTARNFDPVRYSGRWFEVASLKRGFAGQGQEDCHCTQGVYTFNMEQPSIQVDTFCVHGGPDGYITGIRGKVQCVSEQELEKTETDLEKVEMIREKCYLRFPTLPFIPKEPYDVIATDYDNFAVVSGAKDKSFVQIYSRTPTPGPEFIEKYKDYLADFGYDPSQIKDTPQDCEVMSDSRLAAMMSMSGMQQALTNQFPDLELKKAVQFNPFTSVFDTTKKLVELYFK